MDFLLFWGAGTEQVRQVFRASMAMRSFAYSNGSVSERILTLFAQKALSLPFLIGITFSQCVLTRGKGAAEIVLRQYVWTTMEAIFLFYGIHM